MGGWWEVKAGNHDGKRGEKGKEDRKQVSHENWHAEECGEDKGSERREGERK